MIIRALLILLVPGMVLQQLFSQSFTDLQKQEQTDAIVEACRHAWTGYKAYASGYDALKPVSRTGHNWYKTSFLMTPVDAFDTFILLGMKKEAKEAKKMVLSGLSFDVDEDVQLFEISIRLLGGLLSSYEIDGDPKFRELAVDLGSRLLPAFQSPTGMPYRYVNLRTGQVSDSLSNPAEVGTYILEFGKLTQLTGDSIYYKTAKQAMVAVYQRRDSRTGLVGTVIDVTSGRWVNPESQIGARIDSYFEYLWKGWYLFGDPDLKHMWDNSLAAISKNLYRPYPRGMFLTRVDMHTGKETRPYYGALEAYFAGLLAMSGKAYEASRVQQANYVTWTRFGIEPEVFDFTCDTIINPSYPLRPENIESCFYLYRTTRDERYLFEGQRMIQDIFRLCRTDAGFAQLKDVITLEKEDYMESFFLAETLKYAYLLFAPETTIDLEKFVFNTEAHPMKRIINDE